MSGMSDAYVIRPVRVDDWPAVKELRLAALQDPVAPLAFLETYEQAETHPDDFWKDRAARCAEGGLNRQFVAEGPRGDWAGSVTVLVEEPGTEDFLGERVAQRQAHLVGVFVREGYRGGRVAPELFRAAVGWARAREGVSRVRLFVHEDNARAQGFYRKAGFRRTRVVGDEYEMELRPSA
ncbi:GNAT family N-acetyltransferase [Streptomyces sp. JJ36]|uniref:GNAT family N-acetyltransferase n=1 Tax=Streptomyces sp. JJ36 TaxID=2736645 RepID=UPI001F3D8C95|nr:N-acetyltransferase [Streptomyces sp. JJ36]MCF6523578.1 GNAT family N-acetyltransferase [Streptomyces sp. JJ36]